MHEERTDVAIVGAGPIGLELAVALRGSNTRAVVVDAGPIGATMAWWAPGTVFFSSPERIAIAGVPLVTPDQRKASREEYLDYLRGVAGQFGLDVRTFRRVTDASREDGGFRLELARSGHGVGGPAEAARAPGQDGPPSERLHVARVVLAIGDMHRARRIGIPGEDLPHVSHFLGSPHDAWGQRVLVVGGKNSAVEAALRLYRAVARVAMSYRGDAFDPGRVKYWLRPEIEWLIRKGRIAWHPRTVPAEVRAETVRLEPLDGGVAAVVPADRVLLMTGYEQDGDLFDRLGVERHGPGRGPRFDSTTMETSVPGVFVAGTAAAGTQSRARLFIENTHVHVDRICRTITGRGAPWGTDPVYGELEEA